MITGREPGAPDKLVGAFFGPPKTGKTTGATPPNTLLISFDPGGADTHTLIGRKDVLVAEPKTYIETMDIVRALQTTDRGRFDWVTLDSLTFMMDRFGGRELNQTYQEGKDVRRAYGKINAACNDVISGLVHLDEQNVMLISHLVNKENDNETTVDTELGESGVKLALPPGIWKLVGAASGFIGRTFTRTSYEKNPDKTRNKVKRFYVSFDDGERSPVGSRYEMDGEYEMTPTLLAELATSIVQEK